MDVFLLRHADADADIPDGLGDEARALTAKSRSTIATHFAHVAPRLGRPDWILTSPLVRCVQTAQILATTLAYDGILHAHRSLLPDMPVGAIDTIIKELRPGRLVLVGHQPSMGAMASHLLQVPNFPPFSPGSVLGLSLPEKGPAIMRFFAVPGQSVLESL